MNHYNTDQLIIEICVSQYSMVELGRLGCMETKAMKKIVLNEFLFVNQVFYFKQLLVGACLKYHYRILTTISFYQSE